MRNIQRNHHCRGSLLLWRGPTTGFRQNKTVYWLHRQTMRQSRVVSVLMSNDVDTIEALTLLLGSRHPIRSGADRPRMFVFAVKPRLQSSSQVDISFNRKALEQYKLTNNFEYEQFLTCRKRSKKNKMKRKEKCKAQFQKGPLRESNPGPHPP